MAQIASRSYLDYGMNPFNWDNYDLGLGFNLGVQPFSFLGIQQRYSYTFEKYNPGLYFFLDNCRKHELSTTLASRLAPDNSLTLSHVLRNHQGGRDAEKLASDVRLGLSSGHLGFAVNVEHSYLNNQVDGLGANLSYKTGNKEAALVFDVGWRARAFERKIINDEIRFGVTISLGKFASSIPKEKPQNDSDLDYKINNNMSFKEASTCLNSIQRVSNFFGQNITYNYLNAERWYQDHDFEAHLSPEQLFQNRMGVCGDQSLAQSAWLVENGYPMSYDLGIWRPGPGHSIAMTFDPRSERWFAMEAGTCYRLSTRNGTLSPEEAAEAILIARGNYRQMFDLFNPPRGFLYEGKSNDDLPYIRIPHRVGDIGDINTARVIIDGSMPDDFPAGLLTDMGAITYIGKRFWE